MKTLYFVDSNGNYLGGFSEGNPAIPKGAIIVELPPNNAKDIFNGREWIGVELNYKELRAKAYPSLDEQADMAYWDRQNNTTTLDDAITAVKTKYPKRKNK